MGWLVWLLLGAGFTGAGLSCLTFFATSPIYDITTWDFWKNVFSVLFTQPGYFLSAPGTMLGVLFLVIGLPIGLFMLFMAFRAFKQRPKEIKIAKGKPLDPKDLLPMAKAEVERSSGRHRRRKPKDVTEIDLPMLVEEPVVVQKPVVAPSKPSVVSQKPVHSVVQEEEPELETRSSRGVKVIALLGGMLVGFKALQGNMKQAAVEASAKRAATKSSKNAKKAELQAELAATKAASLKTIDPNTLHQEEEPQDTVSKIMEWYGAWTTVKAGQRPQKMMEHAKLLMQEVDGSVRNQIRELHGLRGVTVLSMLESAARAADQPLSMGQEDHDTPFESFSPKTPALAEEEGSVDDYFKPYESSQQGDVSESSGPVEIEDDIEANTHRSKDSIARPVISSSEGTDVGPMEIEDDIGRPAGEATDSDPVASPEVELQEMLPPSFGGFGGPRAEEDVPEDSADEPVANEVSKVADVETPFSGNGWPTDFGVTNPVSEPVSPKVSDPEVSDAVETPVVETPAAIDAAIEEFFTPKNLEPEEPLPSKDAKEEEVFEGGPSLNANAWPDEVLSPSPAPQEALVQEEHAESASSDVSEDVQDTRILEAPSAVAMVDTSARDSELAAPQTSVESPQEAAESASEEEKEDNLFEKGNEAFPSGIDQAQQEDVIGPLLSDPSRKAAILGVKEGSQGWVFQKLQQYNLLGISDKTNPVVPLLWESLQRLVDYQAQSVSWERFGNKPPLEMSTQEQREAFVVKQCRDILSLKEKLSEKTLIEIRSIKAGTEHLVWLDGRANEVSAALSSPKVLEKLKSHLAHPMEEQAEQGGKILRVLSGGEPLGLPNDPQVIEAPYEEMLDASHEIHVRYKKITKELLKPLYRSLSVRIRANEAEESAPMYAQIEIVVGDVGTVKAPGKGKKEGSIGIIFVKVPSGPWRIAPAENRSGQDQWILEGEGENAGRLIKVRDRSLEIFRKWIEQRNMRAHGVIHLLCEEGTVIAGLDKRWGGWEFRRDAWGQKDWEAAIRDYVDPK